MSEKKRPRSGLIKTDSRIVRINRLMERLLRSASLNEKLDLITDAIVDIFGADFCRIWMIKAADLCDNGCRHADVSAGPHICRVRERCLHLQSSSGRYTDIDGEHKRVPFGCYKIGRIAAEEAPKFIINDVITDPRIHNSAWAKRLGLVSFAGYRLLSASEKPIGVLALFSAVEITFDEDILLESLAIATAQVIQTALAEEASQRSKDQLRRLAGRIQAVREEDRRMIARDFHDELGQSLTILKFDLSWIKKRLTDDQSALNDKIDKASQLILKTAKTVQRISSQMRPTVLDDLGIVAAIEWQLDEFQSRTGIQCNFSVKPNEVILDEKISIDLFRIFQEALTNVARHSGAKKALILLRKNESGVTLEIVDDGVGISQKEISDPQSIGLTGIKERVYQWGGRFEISGKPGNGTTLEVTAPLPGSL